MLIWTFEGNTDQTVRHFRLKFVFVDCAWVFNFVFSDWSAFPCVLQTLPSFISWTTSLPAPSSFGLSLPPWSFAVIVILRSVVTNCPQQKGSGCMLLEGSECIVSCCQVPALMIDQLHNTTKWHLEL